MIQNFIQRTLPFVVRIGSDPNDDDDIRLQKSLLVVCAIPFIFAGAAWGIMYILFNEPLAGAIPVCSWTKPVSILSELAGGPAKPVDVPTK